MPETTNNSNFLHKILTCRRCNYMLQLENIKKFDKKKATHVHW
jgi:hypothetical protein